jgi:Ankyrin repeats (3 copies)
MPQLVECSLRALSAALHYAARAGSLACVILLVGRPEKPRLSPEEVNAEDKDRFTALHLAAIGGHEKVCGALIAMGASLDAMTTYFRTPWLYALQEHPDKASLHELLAGRGPANLPGTVCDHCAKPAGKRMVSCVQRLSDCALLRCGMPAGRVGRS